MTSNETVSKLIELGNAEKIDPKFVSPTRQEYRDIFSYYPEDLSEFIALIKGKVIYEENGNSFGSVSTIFEDIKELEKRVADSSKDQQKALELLNWIINYRKVNIYLPWGYQALRHIKHLSKFTTGEELYKNHIEARRVEDQLRLEEAKKRRVEKKEKYKIEADEKIHARQEFIGYLESLPEDKIIETIISSDKYTINFFPEKYARVVEKNLQSLSKQNIQTLIQKLKFAQKGAWRDLKNKLVF